MNRKVLCDTNVWLDYYIGMRKGHDAAARLIKGGIRNDISFMVPASCLGDFFYLCQADFKKALVEVFGKLCAVIGSRQIRGDGYDKDPVLFTFI